MFKKFLHKLKVKVMLKFIDKWLADLIDMGKAKSPKVFALIAAVLTFLKTGIGDDHVLSLAWILEQIGVDPTKQYLGDTIDGWLTYIIALFVTTSTTAYLSNPTRKQRRIQKSKEVSAKMAA